MTIFTNNCSGSSTNYNSRIDNPGLISESRSGGNLPIEENVSDGEEVVKVRLQHCRDAEIRYIYLTPVHGLF